MTRKSMWFFVGVLADAQYLPDPESLTVLDPGGISRKNGVPISRTSVNLACRTCLLRGNFDTTSESGIVAP
ncbi:uncharacterized protein GGS22DRAFT_165648 [Annulohypoxylon maeteangense]|uniref:uncharacterized protein n=1 Tax=Annulohypoxylon maeteangense TaxID=1927788 RepID=UPI002008D05C|nr:uncharacterized protein GGS22DRAFT_165648 [Annulohypoxylon maeteangense]KAI0884460.1 hypothetical protein GGS22DRAFT_165648 [Annulohypoxylon maeteangense]